MKYYYPIQKELQALMREVVYIVSWLVLVYASAYLSDHINGDIL